MASQSHPAADMQRLRRAFFITVSFILLLWAVKILEYLAGLDFTQLGIYPRQATGLIGILCAPLVHASFAHLFSNSATILMIGTMLLYGYPRASRVLLPAVYFGGGLGAWLFAREAYHIGASGLAFGMLFFILTVGIIRWDRRAIALSLVGFFLYGSMIWGVLPLARDISFESHLSGALIGTVLAFMLRHLDPAPPRKQYSWEHEDEEEADDGDGFR
jgi:membrane associated rhomboid family serine protease